MSQPQEVPVEAQAKLQESVQTAITEMYTTHMEEHKAALRTENDWLRAKLLEMDASKGKPKAMAAGGKA